MDYTIALQSMLPKIDSPIESQTKALQLSQLANAGRQADFQARQNAIAESDDAAYRTALRANPQGGEGLLSALASSGNYKGLATAQKADLDRRKTLADLGKTEADTQEAKVKALNQSFALHRDQLNTVNDPTSAAQWVAAAYKDPNLGPLVSQSGPLETAVSRIPTDPAGFQQWKQQASLNAENYVKQTTVDANTAARNATSLQTNAATNATSRANNAATIGAENARSAASRKTQLTIAGLDEGGQPTNDIDINAKGIAEGKIAPLTGFALARPRGQAIMARVLELNPSYDAGDYAAKNNALKAFSTGKEGAALRSFNVATDHLQTLSEAADALGNGDVNAFNKAKQFIATQTGGTAPTNFDAVKAIVAKEVVKAIVAGGGGVAEREELSNLMNKANSPQQLKGVINHYTELMSAQKEGLLDQYQRTTGRTNGKEIFAPSKGRNAAPATNAKGWALHVDAQGNKAYVSPDGQSFEEVK